MTIDCSACMEKANTQGTADATGVVVAVEPGSGLQFSPRPPLESPYSHSNDRPLAGLVTESRRYIGSVLVEPSQRFGSGYAGSKRFPHRIFD